MNFPSLNKNMKKGKYKDKRVLYYVHYAHQKDSRTKVEEILL